MIKGSCFYLKHLALFFVNVMCVGQDHVVGIATHYGLYGPVDHIPLGVGFSTPFQAGPGPHPDSCTVGTGSFFLA